MAPLVICSCPVARPAGDSVPCGVIRKKEQPLSTWSQRKLEMVEADVDRLDTPRSAAAVAADVDEMPFCASGFVIGQTSKHGESIDESTAIRTSEVNMSMDALLPNKCRNKSLFVEARHSHAPQAIQTLEEHRHPPCRVFGAEDHQCRSSKDDMVGVPSDSGLLHSWIAQDPELTRKPLVQKPSAPAFEAPPQPTPSEFHQWLAARDQKLADYCDMSGWLRCYGHSERSASASRQGRRSFFGRSNILAQATAGTSMSRFFWKSRWVELQKSELRCWGQQPGTNTRKAKYNRPLLTLHLATLQSVHVEGTVVILHICKTRWPLHLAADTAEETLNWASAIKVAASRALSPKLPPHWNVPAMLSSGVGANHGRLVNRQALPPSAIVALQKLLDHTSLCKSTKDRRGKILPCRLELVEAFSVQNGPAWMEYSEARSRVAFECLSDNHVEFSRLMSDNSEASTSSLATRRSHGQSTEMKSVLTSTINDSDLLALLGDTYAAANEHLLFHGTVHAAVNSISEEEFRLDFAGSRAGTLFGKGIYLAESCTKADEYAKEDENGLCWMLLCRAALGNPMVCTDVSPPQDVLENCRSSGYHSLIGDRWAAVGTYREFVLHDANQVYPALILQYRRWSEARLCGSLHESVRARDQQALSVLFQHVAMLAEEHPDRSLAYKLLLVFSAHASSAVPVLTRCLSDTRRRVRLSCIFVLMQLAMQTVTVEAWDGTISWRNVSERKTPAVVQAVPALIKALSDSEAKVRASAARTLERLGDFAASAAPALLEKLADEDLETRMAAVAALGQVVGSPVPGLSALFKVACDDEECVRVVAVKTIASIGSKPADLMVIPSLMGCLEDTSTDVRHAAAEAFGQSRLMLVQPFSTLQDAMSALAAKLQDSEICVRSAAASSLGLFGHMMQDNVLSKLTAALEDSHQKVRCAALYSLGYLGPRSLSTIDRMMLALADPDAIVREAAAKAVSSISKHDSEVHLRVIEALAKRGLSDPCSEVQAVLAGCLAEMSRHFLPASLEDFNDLKFAMMSVLETADHGRVCRELYRYRKDCASWLRSADTPVRMVSSHVSI
eukprot:TRINITY_DN102996_c0_g1_i1.p1 TRINITY_DN102996_c0_g1~~TRINITY_DN102996_c0_g1_i1.p1  ORF type:complete len:1072 (+),score=148.58 TRINITY_DN102996_c0_g1_i1:37-3252(+)